MSETLLYKILAQLEKPEISTGFLPDFRLVKMLDDTVNVIFSKSWGGRQYQFCPTGPLYALNDRIKGSSGLKAFKLKAPGYP